MTPRDGCLSSGSGQHRFHQPVLLPLAIRETPGLTHRQDGEQIAWCLITKTSGVKQVAASLLLAVGLLTVEGAAIVSAASPDPSATPTPAASSTPSTTTPGTNGTHDQANCPNM